VSPPRVNNVINPISHNIVGLGLVRDPWRDPNHLKILIPVGTAIIIVAVVK
jgi:hypothetical protein